MNDETGTERKPSCRRRTLRERERPVKRRTISQHYTTRSTTTTTIATPGKRKRDVVTNILRLSTLQVPISLSKLWISQTSVSILVDYLLYTRELFPLTVAELTANLNSTVGPYSSPPVQRKLNSANAQRQRFFQHWNSHSTSRLIQRASCAMITIGPSYGRGTESYLMDIRGLQTENSGSQENSPPSHVLARKLLPKIAEANLSLNPSSSASSRIFVSLWLSHEQAQLHWSETSTAESTSDIESTLWIPRLGRALPTLEELRQRVAGRNPRQRLVALSIRHGIGSDEVHGGTGTSFESMADEGILDSFNAPLCQGQWVYLPQAIKGFRM